MPDLVLTHGFFLAEDEIEQQIMRPYPPLGLLYLSAYLKRHNLSVEIYDSTFHHFNEFCAYIAENQAGLLGVYATHATRPMVIRMIRKASHVGWTVIVGGPDGANWIEEYLGAGADFIVCGEGEQTLLELVYALQSGGSELLATICGIAFRRSEGELTLTSQRQVLPIDEIPWPDRKAIDLSKYLDSWREHHSTSSINVVTARGCGYRCSWCSHAVFGASFRKRDYLDCVDEIEMLQQEYRPDQYWFVDDVFTVDHRWLSNFATELERRKLVISFETISRADRMMDIEIVNLLQRMGCKKIWIGSESGSHRILDAMKRDVTPEQIQWAVKQCKAHDIETGIFLMWGYPGETIEDIKLTIELVKACQPDMFFTTVVYPIKNTPLYREYEASIKHPVAWESSTDKDMALPGRQSDEYYKMASKWLKLEVQAARLELTDPLQSEELYLQGYDCSLKLKEMERSREELLNE